MRVYRDVRDELEEADYKMSRRKPKKPIEAMKCHVGPVEECSGRLCVTPSIPGFSVCEAHLRANHLRFRANGNSWFYRDLHWVTERRA